MVYQPLTKERFDEIVDECFRAVDHAFDAPRREPGNEHGAHGVLEEESDMERDRR